MILFPICENVNNVLSFASLAAILLLGHYSTRHWHAACVLPVKTDKCFFSRSLSFTFTTDFPIQKKTFWLTNSVFDSLPFNGKISISDIDDFRCMYLLLSIVKWYFDLVYSLLRKRRKTCNQKSNKCIAFQQISDMYSVVCCKRFNRWNWLPRKQNKSALSSFCIMIEMPRHFSLLLRLSPSWEIIKINNIDTQKAVNAIDKIHMNVIWSNGILFESAFRLTRCCYRYFIVFFSFCVCAQITYFVALCALKVRILIDFLIKALIRIDREIILISL